MKNTKKGIEKALAAKIATKAHYVRIKILFEIRSARSSPPDSYERKSGSGA